MKRPQVRSPSSSALAERLKDDALNPADARAAADDQVTLPDILRDAPKSSDKRRMHVAMSFSAGAVAQGSSFVNNFGASERSHLKLVR